MPGTQGEVTGFRARATRHDENVTRPAGHGTLGDGVGGRSAGVQGNHHVGLVRPRRCVRDVALYDGELHLLRRAPWAAACRHAAARPTSRSIMVTWLRRACSARKNSATKQPHVGLAGRRIHQMDGPAGFPFVQDACSTSASRPTSSADFLWSSLRRDAPGADVQAVKRFLHGGERDHTVPGARFAPRARGARARPRRGRADRDRCAPGPGRERAGWQRKAGR
jgi:hypothetical protein